MTYCAGMQVTVLFIRMLGLNFSTSSGGVATPELRKVQRAVKLIQHSIYKYEGCFSRLSVDDKGAVVLGVFGLPPAHPNDAERACKAAGEFCNELRTQLDGQVGRNPNPLFCAHVHELFWRAFA